MAEFDNGAPAGPPADSPAEGGAETSLRDDIDAAFTDAASDEPAAAPADGRMRDPSGRFAPKPAPMAGEDDPAHAAQSLSNAPGQPPQGVTRPPPRPGPQDAQQEAAQQELRAPAQWKPSAREKWGTVDPEVRSEINRREREFQTHLQGSAGLRDFVAAFEDIVRPYEMFIRAENSNPLAAVANLFQTAAALRVETPANKARMVAGLCSQYAIDLHMLDTALAQSFGVAQLGANGQPMPQQPAQQAQFRDPRVDAFLYQQAQYQAQAEEAERQELTGAAQQFASENEFFEDVREEMADMIEVAARRGQILTVKDAYEKACKLHPEVSKILAQRAAGANARVTTQAALRARRAASSVKSESSPHGVTIPANDTLRASIEAAFESAGNSRL